MSQVVQATLFSLDAAIGRIDRRCFDTPNPAGRKVLKFRYRARKSWRADLLDEALSLIAAYFSSLGGFRVADQRTVGIWYRALAGGLFTAEQLRQAIVNKRDSILRADPAEHRRLRDYVAHPAKFLRVAGYWLSHPQKRTAGPVCGPVGGMVASARENAIHAALDRLAARRGQAFPGPLIEWADRVAAQVDRWEQLEKRRQAVALAAVRPAFIARCEQWGEQPTAEHMQGVLREMAIEFASRHWPPESDLASSSALSLSGRGVAVSAGHSGGSQTRFVTELLPGFADASKGH